MGIVLLLLVNACIVPTTTARAAESVGKVVVSQAGYSANAYKVANVIATDVLTDTTYQVLNGTTVIASGNMTDEGTVWGNRVYSIDFSSVTQTGTNFTIKSNGVSSYPFPIQPNIWDGYKDEMTAFYRLLRSGISTADAYPSGYSSILPSAKLYHGAGHLDDAASADGTQHYDLVGSWYDAGDYGKYGGNQWVTGEIALAYLRNASSPLVRYDNDANGVPDLLDEARFGSEWLIKFATQFNGALYNIKNGATFVHPDKATDNIPGTADDRKLDILAVGGSAKAAGALAATARAINGALAEGHIASDRVAEFTAFANSCSTAAVTCYAFAVNNPDGNQGSYVTNGGLPNALLWAEVELYLLTNDTTYKTSATGRITPLTFSDIKCTNYWDMRPMAMAEFYPVADTATQTKIQTLLKQQMDYFLSSSDDTPYGMVDEFGTFGMNEIQASYLGDALRYYELFNDPAVLRAVIKGTYWIFGNNPWNISWVSGVGTDPVDFLHTRFDEQSYDKTNTGIVLPGAMVSGPVIKDPMNQKSASPWYQDRPLWQDDTNQWRYNEFSISIQAGFLYTIMGLTRQNEASTAGGTTPAKIKVTSPKVGDYVTGDVTLFAKPQEAMSAVAYSNALASTSYTAMASSNGVYSASLNVDAEAPFANKRYYIRGTDASGKNVFSNTHFAVAAPLPDPAHPLLYDDFGNGGTWGSVKLGWVNWYNQNGGTGTYTQTTADGRTVGKFTQTSTTTTSYAKFEPWHDAVDLSGYRYLNFTLKNPGYPNSRIKIEINDGTKTYQLSGGYLNVPTTWTNYSFDMNQFTALTDKSKIHLAVWLNQTVAGYGEMLMDGITATTAASGTAPVITAGSLNDAAGNEDTLFTYSATYTDADNEEPFALQVVIDGVIHDMVETDPADTTYTDGKTYTYSTALPAGSHSYYFRTTDTSSALVKTAVQSGPVVNSSELFYEAENLTVNAISGGDTRVKVADSNASGGYWDQLNDNALNDFIEYKVNVPASGTYNIKVRVKKGGDRGLCQLSIDGMNQGAAFDEYASATAYTEFDLGNVTFTTPGDKLFRFKAAGKNASSLGYKLWTDYVKLTKL